MGENEDGNEKENLKCYFCCLYILSFSIAKWLRDLVSVSSVCVQVFAHQEEQREVENREGNSWSNKEPDQDQ